MNLDFESSLLERIPLLRQIVESKTVLDDRGAILPASSGIPLPYAEALYRTVLSKQPKLVIEIGMAQGISTLAILSALRDAGKGGFLISIDPFQSTDWRNVGVTNVHRANLTAYHQLIEQVDYEALPDLLKAKKVIDFAYIDGWHTFDYTLLDFWFLDKMLPPGGVVAFNDCAMKSVRKAIGFVKTHRKYKEMDVGSKYRVASNPLKSIIFYTLYGWRPDRYFEKLESWEPAWNYYAPF